MGVVFNILAAIAVFWFLTDFTSREAPAFLVTVVALGMTGIAGYAVMLAYQLVTDDGREEEN